MAHQFWGLCKGEVSRVGESSGGPTLSNALGGIWMLS